MRPNAFNLAGPLRPTQFKSAILLAAAVLGATAGLPGTHGVLARPQGAHWTAEQAGRHMLALCDAYKGAATLEEMPTYLGDTWLAMPIRFFHRHAWAGFVHINGQVLQIILNDRTGSVIYVFHGGESAARGAPQVNAGCVTPAQAARLSMNVIRSLEMVPRGASVALAGIPTVIKGENVWRVTWQVQDGPMTAAYQIKVALQQHDGRLITATNCREQALYSPHQGR